MSQTPRKPTPLEVMEMGMIRARTMVSRYGIASAQTLAVITRYANLAADARQAQR